MKLLIVSLASLLASCMSTADLYAPKRMDVAPIPFPYPGIYNAAVRGGPIPYRLDADGRGLSCSRAMNGRMAYGDVRYTGARLHTEDWTFDVLGATADELVISWGDHSGVAPATLHRVSEAPTTCQGYFAQHPSR